MKNLALIGADPEAFVKRGPQVSHCINMLGGDKQFPRLVMDGAVQEDNVLFEFNVDPTANPAEFRNYINHVLSQGQDILSGFGLRIAPSLSSHVYENMDGFPEKAFEFGCTPDYNCFGGAQNPVPSSVNPFLRTAGGHVHIGFSHLTTVTKELQEAVGCMCDYLLGLPSLLEDDDAQRRELYGKAGAIRYKPYGVEYRTLSNYWIWSDDTINTIHARAQKAYDDVAKLALYQALVPQADVQAAINNNDRQSAIAFLKVLEDAAI